MDSVWVGMVLIVGQGVIAGTVLYVGDRIARRHEEGMSRYTQRLEGFTEALLETQESNRLMRESNVALVDELRGLRARNAAGEVA